MPRATQILIPLVFLLAPAGLAQADPCGDHAVSCGQKAHSQAHQDCRHGGRCLDDPSCCHRAATCSGQRCHHPEHMTPLERARLRTELAKLRARAARSEAKAASRRIGKVRRSIWRARDRYNYTGSRADRKRLERLQASLPEARQQAAWLDAAATTLEAQAADAARAEKALEGTRPGARREPGCDCL